MPGVGRTGRVKRPVTPPPPPPPPLVVVFAVVFASKKKEKKLVEFSTLKIAIYIIFV